MVDEIQESPTANLNSPKVKFGHWSLANTPVSVPVPELEELDRARRAKADALDAISETNKIQGTDKDGSGDESEIDTGSIIHALQALHVGGSAAGVTDQQELDTTKGQKPFSTLSSAMVRIIMCFNHCRLF